MKHFIDTKIAVLIIIALFSIKATAQQDPQFTQYMYNMSVINPAYATANKGVLNMGGLYRTQWLDVQGAPTTGTFFAHSAINDKIELGVSYSNDNVGDIVAENNFFADFAYVLPVGYYTKISFGVKAGLSVFDTNFNGLQFQSGGNNTDIAFSENINRVFPNLGVGAFFFTDKYYIGFSAPNMLSSTHIENDNGIASSGVEDIHYFLTGGYVHFVNTDLRLKPAFMLRSVNDAPLAFDATFNVLFNNKFEVGLGYRLQDAVIAMANFKISKSLKVGYAYDYTTSNLGRYNSGSHEIFLLFDVDFMGVSAFDRSPRFF